MAKSSKIDGLTLNEIFAIRHYVRYKLGMLPIGIKFPSEEYLKKPNVQRVIKDELSLLEKTGAITITEEVKNETD